MKRFNLRVFLLSSIVITIIIALSVFLTFLGTFAAVMSNFDKPYLFSALADIFFRIFGFPILTIFSRFDPGMGTVEFSILLFLNGFLYSLLIERIFSMVTSRKK